MNKKRPIEKTDKKRTLVISDIHGCNDEFSELLNKLEYNPTEDKLFLLGDYADRGSQSKQVLEKIIRIKKDNPDTVIIKGNHDEWLLQFLKGRWDDYRINIDSSIELRNWLANGGETTLKSLSNKETLEEEDLDYRTYKKLFPELFPFLKSLTLYAEDSHFYYTHAGVDTDKKRIEDNLDEIFYWADRNAFHNTSLQLDKPIIVGHTITKYIHNEITACVKPDKIAIDGGVVFGYNLIGMAIDNKTGQYTFTYVDKNKKIIGGN